MNTSKTLVVLAAGMGSRYGGLKQIDPVGPNGELVIDYSAFDAKRAGFDKIVFVIRRDMLDAFRDGIGKAMEKRMDVSYAFQSLDDLPGNFTVPDGREKPWGTGHAILAARTEINGPFASVNADDFYGKRAYELLAGHLGKSTGDGVVAPPSYAMIGYELQRTVSDHGTVSRGLCRTNARGQLIEIIEAIKIEKTADGIVSHEADGSQTPCDNKTLTSMNCWGFTPAILDSLESRFVAFLEAKGRELKSEFYLPISIGDMITEGEIIVDVLPTPDAWFGVTYREDKPMVTAGIQKLIDANVYPEKLWS